MASINRVDLEPMAMDCLDQEESIASASSNPNDALFDATIGHIEDIIMDDEFQTLQNDFMEKYWQEFEDTEENKFCYTDIHREYTELIEQYLEKQLHTRMPDFSMAEFQKQIISRKEELEGEVFEMLLTFSDFLVFKDMFLDYRAAKEGRTVDFSEGLTVTALVSNPDNTNGLSLGPTSLHIGGSGECNSNDVEEEPMVEGLTPRGDENGSSIPQDNSLH